MILRKCPNHGFEDIAQLSIFINGLKFDMKMLLDAAAGGTIMTLDAEQATRIINTLASTDSQDQCDGRSTQTKGWIEDTLLAQNQILTQQIEQLTTQMAKLPQQLHVLQRQNQELRCELCGGEHSSEQCAYQNISSEEKAFYMEDQGKQGTFQQLQLLDLVSQERMSKMEDSTKKFTHTMLVVQKNVENFETQIKQFTQELWELREKCKSITTRSGVVVGKGIDDNLQSKESDIESEERKIDREEKKEKEEKNKSEEGEEKKKKR